MMSGFTSLISWANFSRGSSCFFVIFLIFNLENGWHGAHPANTLMVLFFSPNSSLISFAETWRISLFINLALLLYSYPNLQELSLSMPATTSRPSLMRPWVNPPIPQKRSITFIFFELYFLSFYFLLNINIFGREFGTIIVG